MVRSVLSLSVLLSLVVLAAFWAMEDPQPWGPAPDDIAPVGGASPAAPREASLRRAIGAEEPAGSPSAPVLAVPCVGATLLGTLVGETGELSFAAVDLGDRVVTATFGDGLDCGVVSGIEPDRVLLRGKNGERVVMVRTQADRTVGAPPRVAGLSATPSVKHHSQGLYELSRAQLEQWLVEPSPQLMNTRLLPAFEEGRVAGYQVRFAESSPLGSLGLKSGDVVRSVNGIALNGPAATLDAYQRIREYGTGEVELLRGGAAVKLRYVLR